MGRPEQGADITRQAVVESGSSAEIDQCWFGGGTPVDEGESAIFTYSDTGGVVNVERSYFYRGGVRGVDSRSDPKMQGGTNFEQCYFGNTLLNALRTGSPNHPAHVTDCTIVYTSMEETRRRNEVVQSERVGQGRPRGVGVGVGVVGRRRGDRLRHRGPVRPRRPHGGRPRRPLGDGVGREHLGQPPRHRERLAGRRRRHRPRHGAAGRLCHQRPKRRL